MEHKDIKTFVLVDDDPVSIFISTKIIEQKFASRVVPFANAMDALDAIKHWGTFEFSNFPVMIFLDLHMPYMDGNFWSILKNSQQSSVTAAL